MKKNGFLILIFLFFLNAGVLQVNAELTTGLNLQGQEKKIIDTLSYFDNRRYNVVFHLFYALPIGLAYATTKTFIYGETAILTIEINSMYHHNIESCFSVRTGKPLWHKWKIESIFGKKDISAFFDNDKGLIYYTKNNERKTLNFKEQVYDPLSAMTYYIAGQTKYGKLKEGELKTDILWYNGNIYNALLGIKKEKKLFRVEVLSNKKPGGYAYFDEFGRPIGGEAYAFPFVGRVSVYDNKLKR